MSVDYLMYCMSVLYFCRSSHEVYIHQYNNYIYLPHKFIMLVATIFALSYSIINKNNVLIISYGFICLLDVFTLLLMLYCAYCRNGLSILGSDDTNNELLLFLENKSNDVEDIIDIFIKVGETDGSSYDK